MVIMLTDIILFVSNFILMVSMIPQILSIYQTKHSMSIICCVSTILPLIGIFISNYLIGYELYALIPSLITALCWIILLVLSLKYRKVN